MMRLCPPALAVFVLTIGVGVGQAAPPRSVVHFDETTLRQAGVGTDAASLLKLLRDHANTNGDLKKINALIDRLGSDQFVEREIASIELIAVGRPAVAALRKARKTDADPEVRLRAGHCLNAIENRLDADVAFAAVRQLMVLHPDGSAKLLLALLPDADWETQEEIVHGLHQVALRDGKLDPALLAALEDKSPLRRAAAVLAVVRVGKEPERAHLRKLLADPDATVRLRVAQALLSIHDAGSLPVLIALLNERFVEISWSAEELLHWVAGSDAPAATVGGASDTERKNAVAAWTSWLKDHGAKIDWEQLEQAPRRPGLYFVCETNRVWLGGCDGKVRWTMPGHYGAQDIVLLPGNQLVVAPFNGDAVLLKRELTGKELWKYVDENGSELVACQRLANGHFFTATESSICEISDSGKPIMQFPLDNFSIGDARILRNGRALLRRQRGVAEVDANAGLVVRNTLMKGFCFGSMNKFAVLPDGRWVMADPHQNQVFVVDQEGRPQWSVTVRNPWGVEVLRNGNFLVSTLREQRILEIDPQGHTVWEGTARDRTIRVRAILDQVRIGFEKPRPKDYDIDSVAWRVRSLKDPDPLVRRRSATFLGYLKPTDGTSLAALVAALDDVDQAVRTQVSRTLALVGPPALGPLIATLKKGTVTARGGAVVALALMGPTARDAVPPLLDILKDVKQSESLRCCVAVNLGRFGAEAKLALPVFRDMLRDPKLPAERADALVQGLEAMGADGVPALALATKEGHSVTRLLAINHLSQMGMIAKPALPALKEAAKDPDRHIRTQAARAIRLIERGNLRKRLGGM